MPTYDRCQLVKTVLFLLTYLRSLTVNNRRKLVEGRHLLTYLNTYALLVKLVFLTYLLCPVCE